MISVWNFIAMDLIKSFIATAAAAATGPIIFCHYNETIHYANREILLLRDHIFVFIDTILE